MARSVLDLLLEIQLIDDRQHEDVLSRATGAAGGHLIQTVCELGYATESSIARALSAELGLQRADLAATAPQAAALALVDAKLCHERFVLPVSLHEGGTLLWLAMADPTDADTVAGLGRRLQKRVRPLVAGPSEILRAATRLSASFGAPREKTGPVAPPAQKAPPVAEPEPATEAAEGAVSPLARIAAALGVRVPQRIQRRPKPAAAVAGPRAGEGAGPASAEPSEGASAAALVDDLAPEDIQTLEALRASLDKGALVLRVVAELCAEKGILTAAEARRKP
ncbi:MAG: hypothetical protein NVSMB23_05440 [Myxococcales bacterium]